MSVAINSTRKAVEISWDPGASAPEPPEQPPGFPAHPIHRPDLDPSHPIAPGGDPDAHPEHPIYLPPYIDNSLPEHPYPEHPMTPPGPGGGEPTEPPSEEIPPGGAFPGDPGYHPPSGAAVPTPHLKDEGGVYLAVQVFAQGQDGDWSNTDVTCNDGLAVLAYPQDFTGESYVEVRALDGTLVDSGSISVA